MACRLADGIVCFHSLFHLLTWSLLLLLDGARCTDLLLGGSGPPPLVTVGFYKAGKVCFDRALQQQHARRRDASAAGISMSDSSCCSGPAADEQQQPRQTSARQSGQISRSSQGSSYKQHIVAASFVENDARV